jgi:hypothetical protein
MGENVRSISVPPYRKGIAFFALNVLFYCMEQEKLLQS